MTNGRVCLLSAGDSAATAAVDRTIIRWRDCDGIGRGTGRHVEERASGPGMPVAMHRAQRLLALLNVD